MKCKYCGSKNLKTRKNSIHIELYCGDCLKFQKFLSKKEAERYNSQIKPCPFCGSKAKLEYNEFDIEWSIYCENDNCIAYALSMAAYNTKEDAIDAWNIRNFDNRNIIVGAKKAKKSNF